MPVTKLLFIAAIMSFYVYMADPLVLVMQNATAAEGQHLQDAPSSATLDVPVRFIAWHHAPLPLS